MDGQTQGAFEEGIHVNLSWEGSDNLLPCGTDCEEWLGKVILCNGGYSGGWEVHETNPQGLIAYVNRCAGRPSGNWGPCPK